ncbi:cilia- and flagella-associated protein 119-like [Halichondria panicea]|uniref:cilia- and flagella-associated protein 119-like n=1 Tax=Halichondria panicea TaxID=6063 RepID=UPI00312B4AE2
MENQFKPRICEWEDLSLTNTEALQTCGVTVEAVKKVLKEILGVSSEDKQSTIELDLYTHALLFAKTNKFSLPQMSAFFTILKSVHKLCISTPFDNQEQALELFNNLLIRHGVSRPPYSVMLFSLQQVKIITDYVLSTYFKHYKMYKYAFTKKVRLSLRLAYSGEDVGEEENKEEEDEKEDTKIDPVEEPDFVEDIEEAEPPNGEDSIEVDPTEEADHRDLKDIVSSTLSKKLKDLEVSIEQEMNTQERKLAERIGALEKLVGEKPKQPKQPKPKK